jgi:hypothetical protein
MDANSFIKVILTAVIGITLASYSSMSDDVTINKVRIDKVENTIEKIGKQIDDLHWNLIRSKK